MKEEEIRADKKLKKRQYKLALEAFKANQFSKEITIELCGNYKSLAINENA